MQRMMSGDVPRNHSFNASTFFPGNLAMLDIKIILCWGKTTGIPEEARERKQALGQADMLLAWGMELENTTQIIYTADAMRW